MNLLITLERLYVYRAKNYPDLFYYYAFAYSEKTRSKFQGLATPELIKALVEHLEKGCPFECKLQKYDQIPSDGNLGKYDINSIMHYDGTLRGFFLHPIMVDKSTGKSIEVNRKMSPIDIQKLNKMYPCKQTGKYSRAALFLRQSTLTRMSSLNFSSIQSIISFLRCCIM